jgi:hypothetical protein
MTNIAYTYCIVKYVHDPVAGETLNIGVLLYAPDVQYLGFKFESRYKRISECFADFDGDQYRRTLRQFEGAMNTLWEQLTEGMSPVLWDMPSDVHALASRLWSDPDVSFRLGPVLAGITKDPADALERLFVRMVTSQYERVQIPTRSDEEVWSKYQQVIPRDIRKVLREKSFETTEAEIKFEHTFKNESWHVLQPVTMDYARPEQLQDKATRWLGKATLLSGHPELSTIYVLLGHPHLEVNRTAYVKAKNILHKMPIKHELVEERDADAFMKYLADYMEEHEVIPKRDI